MISISVCLCVSVAVFASGERAQAQQPKQNDMQVRINYLNVCSPREGDKQEIAAALERIPTAARFGPEFEIARGRTALNPSAPTSGAPGTPAAPDAALASWVRIRREFPPEATFSNAQYSVSLDGKDIIETVVVRWREPKDVMQVSIEDSVSAVASPAAVLSGDTPADRIRIERFGKPSLALSRCPQADQTAYESLFVTASRIMNRYRAALGARESVPPELARLGLQSPQAHSNASKSAKPTPKSQ